MLSPTVVALSQVQSGGLLTVGRGRWISPSARVDAIAFDRTVRLSSIVLEVFSGVTVARFSAPEVNRTRRPTTKAWVCCVLEFKGWRRVQWQPGHLTELYFLDEATALSVGHRPCGLCRVADYRRSQNHWAIAFGGSIPGLP